MADSTLKLSRVWSWLAFTAAVSCRMAAAAARDWYLRAAGDLAPAPPAAGRAAAGPLVAAGVESADHARAVGRVRARAPGAAAMTPLARGAGPPGDAAVADDLHGGAALFPVLDQDIADAEQGGAGDDEQGGVGERQPQPHGRPGPADGLHHGTIR